MIRNDEVRCHSRYNIFCLVLSFCPMMDHVQEYTEILFCLILIIFHGGYKDEF